MISIDDLRSICGSLEDVSEQAHFEKTSFRTKKRIFATFDAKTNLVCVKLEEADQYIYNKLNPEIYWPLSNKWGSLGWTHVKIEAIEKDAFLEILMKAYSLSSPKVHPHDSN